MDYRLALLLHVPLGLILDSDDVARLHAPELDPHSVDAVVGTLQSIAACSYIQNQFDWMGASQAILKLSGHHGIRWSYKGQPDYPSDWVGLSERPIVFSYQGEPCWMNTPLLAVVGSRTPSSETLMWMRRDLSEFLRISRVGIVSGGARGIDQCAHRIAMECDRPTVCILPSGLMNPYPFHHEHLWAQIRAKGGCMMSTCSLNEPLRKSFFHMRNRWIAGLSPICFVAEANRRSGTLLTARRALEEHREICTLPVFPMSPQGLGNLDLLFTGAHPLRDHRDLLSLWDLYSHRQLELNPAAAQGLQCE